MDNFKSKITAEEEDYFNQLCVLLDLLDEILAYDKKNPYNKLISELADSSISVFDDLLLEELNNLSLINPKTKKFNNFIKLLKNHNADILIDKINDIYPYFVYLRKQGAIYNRSKIEVIAEIIDIIFSDNESEYNIYSKTLKQASEMMNEYPEMVKNNWDRLNFEKEILLPLLSFEGNIVDFSKKYPEILLILSYLFTKRSPPKSIMRAIEKFSDDATDLFLMSEEYNYKNMKEVLDNSKNWKKLYTSLYLIYLYYRNTEKLREYLKNQGIHSLGIDMNSSRGFYHTIIKYALEKCHFINPTSLLSIIYDYVNSNIVFNLETLAMLIDIDPYDIGDVNDIISKLNNFYDYINDQTNQLIRNR